jgi:hypothetical protein
MLFNYEEVYSGYRSPLDNLMPWRLSRQNYGGVQSISFRATGHRFWPIPCESSFPELLATIPGRQPWG